MYCWSMPKIFVKQQECGVPPDAYGYKDFSEQTK